MILRCSPTSPFGRKVLIGARHLDLSDRMRLVSADTLDPHDALLADNPLGKMPVLLLDDGRRVHDSPVILEHLDHLAGGGVIIPRDWDARLSCLTLQALADGMLDAALLVLYEARRPETARHPPWIERQTGKIVRGLDALAAAVPAADRVDVGAIAVACLLNHLDRRGQVRWRPRYPALVAWLDLFRRTHAAVAGTLPADAEAG